MQSGEASVRKDSTVLYVIIGVLIGVILLLIYNWPRTDDSVATNSKVGNITLGVIDHMSQEEIQAYVDEQVAASMFRIFINTNVTLLEDGTADLLIQNDEVNKRNTYVEIFYMDSLIYCSGVIPPGYKLEYDFINVSFPEDVNSCTAYFVVLDESMTEMTRVGVNIKIVKGVS